MPRWVSLTGRRNLLLSQRTGEKQKGRRHGIAMVQMGGGRMESDGSSAGCRWEVLTVDLGRRERGVTRLAPLSGKRGKKHSGMQENLDVDGRYEEG